MNVIRKYAFLLLVNIACVMPVFGEGTPRRFMTFDSSYGLADNGAQTIICTYTGRMVISTIGHINFFDGATFKHVDPTSADIFPLPEYNGHYHLYFDRFHHLWLKDKKQVTCLDLLHERFITDVASVFKEIGATGSPDDMFADSDSHLWILSSKKLHSPEYGVTLPVSGNAELHDVDVIDSTAVVLYYADGNIEFFSLKDKHLQSAIATAASADDMQNYSKTSVAHHYRGVIYQIRNGADCGLLQKIEIATGKVSVLLRTPYYLSNITPYKDTVYIPCEQGYWTYDLRTGHLQHYESLLLTDGRQLQTDINDIAFDRQGGMWMGTQQRGLLYSRPFISPFTVYSHQHPTAARILGLMDATVKPSNGLPRRTNCAFIDSRGWLWHGTYTGLLLVRGNNQPNIKFTRKDGLVNEMIHAVAEDHNHNIWASTSNGIARLLIKDNEVVAINNYGSHDDIPTETFIDERSITLDDGTIAFQSVNHVVTLNPDGFHDRQMRDVVLYPKLTNLLVNGIEVEAGVEYDGQVIIDRHITRAKDITVNYRQNSLQLTFSGLNYWRSSQTYYRYRVRGLSEQWSVVSPVNSKGIVDSRGMLHLPLFGLKPGKYEIELQASMVPDYFPGEPYRWMLYVNQPWWRSTGIYILLALIIVALFVVNALVFDRNNKLQQTLNSEEGDIIKRIRNYTAHCNSLANERLSAQMFSFANSRGTDSQPSAEFIRLMLSAVPFVNDSGDRQFTMMSLADACGVDMPTAYGIFNDNLFKNPMAVVLGLRLQKASSLLSSTSLDIEDIAEQCGFASANFFIASFYHQYRQTPQDYRNSTY